MLALVAPAGDLVLLVKPQFEAGRVEAARGRGVIRSPDVWRRVLAEVAAAFGALAATMMGAMVSPLTGADGNVEFLVHAVKGAGVEAGVEVAAVEGAGSGGASPDLDEVVAAAIAVHGPA